MTITKFLLSWMKKADVVQNRLAIENQCLHARVNQFMDDNIALVRENMESEAKLVRLTEQNKLLENEVNTHVDHIFHLKKSLRELGALHPYRLGKRRLYRRAR